MDCEFKLRRKFYLSIFFNLKSGKPGIVNVLDQKNVGYIHAPSVPKTLPSLPRSTLPLFVKLELSGEQTTECQNVLDAYDVGNDFQIMRSVKHLAHQTIVYHKDLLES